ncbi:hypothetical protein AGLY_015407 [Aphis glycines]|uniref:Tc1-like transposase DDE domain-containing protein n=1 Tax=Aphis glycines TaxID=307491 RepID=A0A6G0T0Y0_APHGL|nr:hypothetical protein AGLY_015407 [Aphis glycines]
MSFSNSDTHSQSKKIIYSVYLFLKQLSNKPDVTADFFKNAQVVTAKACGMGYRTVRRICAEAKNSVHPKTPGADPTFVSPRKGYKRARTVSKLDDFDSDVVRRTVHEFYDRGEYPTSQMILNVIKKKTNYTGCIRSLQTLLKNLKFTYKKCNDGRLFLMERNDIVALRCKFLRQMCTLRDKKDDRPVVYLDETWVNQNHSRTLTLQNENNSGGLKVPTFKGGRLIVCHAGCSRYGFIEGSKLVFRSNTGNATDYHNLMNVEVFKEWFIQLLRNLEEPSIIVMDNAPYHSILRDKYPKSNWRKAEVQQWLREKNIEFHILETLPELRQKVKNLLPREKIYELDDIAIEMGHEVIRLPPFHCKYNPIELIWAQVKGQVAKLNNTFKMDDIERLTHEALDAVTIDDWKKCVRHAEAIQDEDNKKEIMRNYMMEPIFMNILLDDSDWSDEEDTDEEKDE